MRLDKLLNSSWFVKVVSLFLGLMLYMAVSMDSTTASPQYPTSTTGTGSQESTALSNVPLTAIFDQNKYAVSNLPKEVTVYLEGTNSLITTTKLHENYKVYVDLKGLKSGKHTVKIQSKGFSKRLNVKIEPSELTVDIQDRVTKEVPVEIDYLNEDQIANGYSADRPIALPNHVKVSGAKSEVDKFGFVKGFIDLSGAKETVAKTIPLKVYDKNGEPLNLMVDPSVVEVKVPIIAPNKTVPIIISRTGELKKGLSINTFDVVPNEITIFGSEEVIKNVEYIDNISFDLSSVTGDVQREIKVPLPKGVKKVSPTTIKVNVDVEPEQKKTIQKVPIKVIGQSDTTDISFVSPSLAVVDLDVYGTKSVLESISAADFHVVLNVSEFSPGKQEADLEVFGPRNVRWSLSTSKAVFEVSRKQ